MAAGSTYTPIATTTLGSSVSTYTFSSIPNTYTDLIFVASLGTTSTTTSSVNFNGDTGTNYSYTQLWGPNGTTPYSQRVTGASGIDIQYSTTTVNSYCIMHIMNYANTSVYKTAIHRSSDFGNGRTYTSVDLWRSTAAISSLTIVPSGGSFATGTTFTLYGIAAA